MHSVLEFDVVAHDVDHIHEHYGSAATWLGKHGADVLALQEVKMNDKHLEQHPRQFEIDGHDAFFACNTTQERAGFDGVATFARQGLVVAADRRPLRTRRWIARAAACAQICASHCQYQIPKGT